MTDARLTAERDVRNFFAQAVMQKACMALCDPNLIMNKDATTSVYMAIPHPTSL